MSGVPLHIAVPDGTAPYWLALLHRSGLPVHALGSAPAAGALLFLPDAAGTRCAATRREVERLRQRGTPALAGREWGATFGVQLPGGRALGLSVATNAGVRRLDPAPLLVLPLPAAAMLLRASAELTTITGADGRSVMEVIATADHGGLRRCVLGGLRSLAFACDRPFVHLAHAPLGFDATLAVRIDADSYRTTATAATTASLARAGLRATWFLDVERHQLHGGLHCARELRAAGHEVQSHFFRHYTYRSAARNEQNLRRSLDELRALGVTATAAAAPFGTWNRGLDVALRACGMRWSSEFSRVHDEVPGAFSGQADEVWQVPIHPVCPALLFAAGADVATVHAWFLAELQQCLQRGEPAVFYGHPIDDLERCPELLPSVAAAARQQVRSLWQPTLGELHDFYRQRAVQTVHVELADDGLRGDVDGRAPLVVERAGKPAVHVAGSFVLPLETTTEAVNPHGPILMPAPYRPRTGRRDRLRTHRLQFARLLRELRR